MLRHTLLVVLLIAATTFAPGCMNGQLSTAEAKLAAYGSSYLGSLATTQLLVKEDKLEKADVRKAVEILKELRGPLDKLEAKENMYVSFYPAIEKIIVDKLDKPTQQNLALAAVGVGLRLADQVLAKHPEIFEQQEEWVGFLKEIIKGLALGMLDAIDEPADSPLRNDLTRSTRHEELDHHVMHAYRTGCGLGLRGPAGVDDLAQHGRVAHHDIQRPSSR